MVGHVHLAVMNTELRVHECSEDVTQPKANHRHQHRRSCGLDHRFRGRHLLTACHRGYLNYEGSQQCAAL